MSCLSGFLNTTATIYSIDFSETTESGQPIETLTLVKTIKCLITDNRKRFWNTYDPGQITTGQFYMFSVKSVQANNVAEIDSIKYRITASSPMNGIGGHVMGYTSYLEHYKH
jgi:hypothetical protein